MAKMSLEFDGFKDLAYRLSEVAGDLKPAATEALAEVQKTIQSDVNVASAKYVKGGTEYSTGRMREAIKPTDGPQWAGDVASIGVGFEIHKAGGGGMHSIWMMYGTPRISKDTKLYNAVRGPLAKVRVHSIMDKVFRKHISLTQ